MPSRLERLRAKLDELKLDGLIVSRNEDQRYLVGYSGHADYDSVLLVSKNDVRLATDFRYWDAAEKNAPAVKLMKLERGKYDIGDALRDFASDNQLHTIGFESQHVNVYRYNAWRKAARKAKVKLKPTDDIIKQLRAVKDEEEIEQIRRAVKLTDDAFAHFLTQVRPGMTEKQGAWVIESYMREHGADRLAFNPIVASGPNAAQPHAEPSERAIQAGEPLTIDIGAQVGEYNADMTRTITLGHASDKFREVYNTVLKAQKTVEKKAHVGMNGKQVDRLARRVIEKAGYGENFGHGVGHGVGRVVHEYPRAGRVFKDKIEPNMLLTVEPGIYIPGWGGVRIEDLVVFREDSIEILTQATKEPVVPLS
ncbi:MAG TPA: Xaa-Pro peptidase family protein [Anaerolineae bacterium]|nr:Xaa-Pro peptidase family protein [Anaerolineae bacterium]